MVYVHSAGQATPGDANFSGHLVRSSRPSPLSLKVVRMADRAECKVGVKRAIPSRAVRIDLFRSYSARSLPSKLFRYRYSRRKRAFRLSISAHTHQILCDHSLAHVGWLEQWVDVSRESIRNTQHELYWLLLLIEVCLVIYALRVRVCGLCAAPEARCQRLWGDGSSKCGFRSSNSKTGRLRVNLS